jgi:hypothetical protein
VVIRKYELQIVTIEISGLEYRFLVTFASESSPSDEKASVEASLGRLGLDFGISKMLKAIVRYFDLPSNSCFGTKIQSLLQDMTVSQKMRSLLRV